MSLFIGNEAESTICKQTVKVLDNRQLTRMLSFCLLSTHLDPEWLQHLPLKACFSVYWRTASRPLEYSYFARILRIRIINMVGVTVENRMEKVEAVRP